MKDENIQIKKSEIWLREDGIIGMKTAKECGSDEMQFLFEEYMKIKDKVPGKIKTIIDISQTDRKYDAPFKKKLTEIIASVFGDPRFEKIAIWGETSKLIHVILSFILEAIGIVKIANNVRHFNTEEEALKWLKED
jgi:hypothetical protein